MGKPRTSAPKPNVTASATPLLDVNWPPISPKDDLQIEVLEPDQILLIHVRKRVGALSHSVKLN